MALNGMSDTLQNIWYLEKFDLIKELPYEVRLELDRCGVFHQNFKKEIVYFEQDLSDTVFFLKKGRVKVSRLSPDGKETTLYLVQPGEIFGEMAIMGDERRTHRAEALDEIMLCSFKRDDFHRLLLKYPELSRRVFRKIGERQQVIEQRLADLVFRSSDDRIIHFLLDYARPHLVKEVDEAFVRPFFTHEEIAHLTATSRQTVTTLLNSLRDGGLIQFDKNKLYVKKFSGLERFIS